MSYFPEPNTRIKNKIIFELHLSSHGTKYNLRNVTVVGTSDFPKKADLANLKSDVRKWDIDKLMMFQMIETVWKVK